MQVNVKFPIPINTCFLQGKLENVDLLTPKDLVPYLNVCRNVSKGKYCTRYNGTISRLTLFLIFNTFCSYTMLPLWTQFHYNLIYSESSSSVIFCYSSRVQLEFWKQKRIIADCIWGVQKVGNNSHTAFSHKNCSTDKV